LLIDQFLPRYDFAVVHAQVFRVPPEVCLRAAQLVSLLILARCEQGSEDHRADAALTAERPLR
jgi:hypothetical protein